MCKNNNNIYYIMIVALAFASIVLYARSFFIYCTHATKSPNPPPNYAILIDLDEKHLYLLNRGKLVKKYPCAVGTPSTPSPIGSYKIKEKAKWGEGFGGYWMGINCTWGNYGIHGTNFPKSIGKAASHGCFRMFNKDIKELYAIIPIGTTVCVVSGCYGPFGNGNRIIEPHMYGRDVQVIQQRLKQLGYYNGYCSGKYDTEDFKTALHKFQRNHGIQISDKIDAKTLKMMNFIIMD